MVNESGTSRVRSFVFFTSLLFASQFLLLPDVVHSFTETATTPRRSLRLSAAGGDVDDEVTRQLARAREVLAISKAKMESKAEEAENAKKSNVPFFASKDTSTSNGVDKKKKVLKTKNEAGLSTFDGDLMAKMSESEQWEIRSLVEVFENEIKHTEDDPLAKRDVAASIFGLQRTLQTDDFRRIFDKRNRWIGEQ